MNNVTMKVRRKSETDEWLVVVAVNGERHEGRTYYTSDREDAECTLGAMVDEARNAGDRVNGETADEAVYFPWLVTLRDSGVTNMWGAAPYLANEFGLSDKDAGDILVRWIQSFNKEVS